jgi:hypothetical protein
MKSSSVAAPCEVMSEQVKPTLHPALVVLCGFSHNFPSSFPTVSL